MATDLLIDGDGERTIVLAHGAGAPMDSDFMQYFASGLAARGLRCVRFEFPYMVERRKDGKKRPPNGQAILLEAYRNVVRELCPDGDFGRLVIGGKSMGGRMASLLTDELGVAALVCLGYPFHPPGKPDKLRTEHLQDLRTPTLIVQGERDTFGSREEVGDYDLAPSIVFEWAHDGDHSLVPRKASGRTAEQNWDEALGAIAYFISSL